MRNFYIVFIIILFISCKRSKRIEFAGYECWNANEKTLELDRAFYLEEYEKYREIGGFELPLTKVVQLDSMLAFIGLLNLDKAEQIETVLRKNANDEFSFKERKYFYSSDGDENFIQCIYTQKDLKYTIVITFVLKNQNAIQEIHSKGDFVQLLNCYD